MKHKFTASIFAVSIMLTSCTDYADMVINGRIFTADDNLPYASALAVKDGTIVYVGDDASKSIGKNTSVIESEGLVVPGFADVHNHGAAAMRLYELIQEVGKDTLDRIENLFENNPASEAEKEDCILNFQKLLLVNGITSTMDAYVNYPGFDITRIYEDLDKDGKISVHTYGAFKIDEESDLLVLDTLSTTSTSLKGGNFELNTIKLMLDGTAGPIDDSTSLSTLWPDRLLSRAIEKTNAAGLTFHSHTVGDSAVKQLVESSRGHNVKAMPNSAVHLAKVDGGYLKKMRDCNITAVITPLCFYKDTTCIDSIRTVYPAKSFIDADVRIAYGSDFPVYNSLSVMEAIYRMVTRQKMPGADSTSLCPGERISVEQALKCVTSGGAYVLGRENAAGSITVGKAADIVLLDRDITTCSEDEIFDTKVVRTIIGGKTLYNASDSVR